MMKTLFLLLLATSELFAQAKNLTSTGDLYIKGGNAIIGSDTLLPYVGLDVAPMGLSGSLQFGAYIEPTFQTPISSGAGIRVNPKVGASAGILSAINGIDIYQPSFGNGSRAKRIYGLYVNSLVNSDSGNYAIYTNLGRISFGDSTFLNKMVQFGGGINYHGRIRTSSGVSRLGDTDCVLLIDIGAGGFRDSLPSLSQSIGRQYIFVQYSTTAAGKYVIRAQPGEKIETYDSVCIQSNKGLSKLILQNTGSKWSILYQHQEGIWAASLFNVSPAVNDTGFYTIDNNNVFISTKPLIGTSSGTTLNVTGMTSIFTDAALDTGYTATATVIAYNNSIKVAGACVMPLSGSAIVCQNVSSGFAAWTATGSKGLPYGIQLSYRLPKQPSN